MDFEWNCLFRSIRCCAFRIADCKNLRIMERVDWLNAIGLIICRRCDFSKELAKEAEEVVKEHVQESVSDY